MEDWNESSFGFIDYPQAPEALFKYLCERKINTEAIDALQYLRELSFVIEKPLPENFVNNLTRLHLEKLHLTGNFLPDHQVKAICKMTKLKNLDISCYKVMVEDILHLLELEELHIAMPFIKNEDLEQLLMGLPHLRAIYLRSSPFITEEFIADWKRPNLEIYLDRGHLTGPLIHQ